MAPRGRGVIVNMSSICGLEGCTGHPHYSAAKAAILGFTKAAAKELIVQGIRVNAVAPGHVGTETLQGEINAERRAIAASTPAGRLAEPEEIAATVAFLASDDASYFVGGDAEPQRRARHRLTSQDALRVGLSCGRPTRCSAGRLGSGPVPELRPAATQERQPLVVAGFATRPTGTPPLAC